MIYFQCRPDEVFNLIVEEALEIALDQMRVLNDTDWESLGTFSSRCLPRLVALKCFEDLLSAHRSRDVFRLSDYLWLLLYESLAAYCEIHNDLAQDSPGGRVAVGEYRIPAIDCDGLCEVFFWDMDFAPFPEGMIPGAELRKAMGMSGQVFGISTGLQPHSSELELTKVNPKNWEGADELLRADSAEYPDFPIDDDGPVDA